MQQQNPEQAAAMRLVAAGGDFQALHEIVAKARQNLNQNDWDYIVGGAETETTLRRNRLALDSIAFRPRVLRDVSRIDPSVEAFGRTLAPARAVRAGRLAGKLPPRRGRRGGAGRQANSASPTC